MKKKIEDRGTYLIILRLTEKKVLRIGRLGSISFKKGFYIYVGSALSNLSSRIKRHMRVNKRKHWHIDKLRPQALFYNAFAIYSPSRLECKIAKILSTICEWKIYRFGSSDCNCESHLFGMSVNPVLLRDFRRLIKSFKLLRFEP